MAFVPRLTASGIYQSPYWYSTTNPFYPAYQMPNCTCYAWGRYWEISGVVPHLPTGNAGTWYDNATGYRRGQTPALGAIACWYSPTGAYAGHVAVVEQITETGIVTSNSGYYRPISAYPPDTPSYFWTETCTESSGYRSAWMINRGYVLKGFIYNDEEPVEPGDLPDNWISKNDYLTEDEMRNNAYIFYSRMVTLYGWTINAVAGALGNIQRESQVNPGVWQNLYEHPENGFGLCQWTPSTKYTNWADSKGYEWDDGNGQCEWLGTMMDETGSWVQRGGYNITWDEWYTSTDSPEELGGAFLYNFENPTDPGSLLAQTEQQSREWFEYLYTLDPNPDIQGDRLSTMPLYMMLRHF